MARSRICCSVGKPPREVIAIALVIGVACAGLRLGAEQTAQSGYLVGPQDELRISVFNEPELSGIFTVDGDGTITFTFIGRVSVDGLTLREVQDEITRRLSDGYLRDPQVSVEVAEFRSQQVYVIGEVARPGILELRGSLSLLEALAEAGGTTAQAGNELTLTRFAADRSSGVPVLPADGDPPADVSVYSLEDIQLLAVVTLRDNDTVNVAKAATFYVTGHVGSPGDLVWTRGMTVLQAIALAGGYTTRGSNRGIRIERQVDGERISISVNDQDLVEAEDIIVVRARRF